MEYNNIYEVDLAILHAVSGGTGGGITSGQVETMIDSALTDYSTTQEVEAMIAASGGSEGSYIAVKSLSEITTPSEGLVANVIDYTSGGTTYLGTGEWIYRDGAWRAKHVWLDRLSTAELAAMYNYFFGDTFGDGQTPNSAKTCTANWFYNKSEWPYIVESAALTTHSGDNCITFTSSASMGNAGDDYLGILYADINSAGTLTKGYYKIPRNENRIWSEFEIAADGTYVSGSGSEALMPLSDWSFDYAYRHRNIKCTASGITWYGEMWCGTDDGQSGERVMTGVINISGETFVGVWGVDENWTPYKISFTKIEAGGSAGKIDVVLPWNTPATSAETAMAAQIVAEATQIYLASGNTNELFKKYNLYVRVENEQCAATVNSLKYVCDDLSQEFSKVLKIGASTYWDGGLLGVTFSLHGDGTIGDAAAVDVSGILNSKLSGMGVSMIRALTQQEYDDEAQYGYDAYCLYIIKPNNQ